MRKYIHARKIILGMAGTLTLSYIAMCLFLFARQRYLIFNPSQQLLKLPSDSEFKMPYENAWISVPGTQDKIHGWWIPPAPLKEPDRNAKNPSRPQVILYLPGRGGNKGNNLWRIKGFHNLGLATFAIDYRGYGQSKGDFPSESQFYADSQAAWNYLTQVRNIPPEQIIVYGESLGGAVALDLAVKQPNAGGLVMQSTFTSLEEAVNRIDYRFRFFPINWILTQRFNSIEKMRSLQVPVLLIHGTADPVVPYDMSQRLYQAAPQRKELLLIPQGGHFQIYRRDGKSHLEAISKFFGAPSRIKFR
jgi:hypothetical protein